MFPAIAESTTRTSHPTLMQTSLRLKLATLFTVALSTFSVFPVNGSASKAIAANFSNREVDQNKFVAVAAPYGKSAHQLLILEQIANSRACWKEQGGSPTTIEPLLLSFDFSGICGRSTDSNGYSVRVGNEDLGWRYSLRVVQRQGNLVLVAYSNTDRSVPEIEIGKTNGLTSGFGKFELNPGWRFTKRVYNGQSQGHVYLTHDQPLDNLIASASPQSPLPTRPVPPINTDVSGRPSGSTSGSIVVPTRPSGSTPGSVVVPTIPTTPGGSTQTPGNVPTVPVRPTPPVTRPPATPPSNTNVSYRVIVPANTVAVQNRVKSLVPSAFRTRLNGQTVMQAGVFREENRAFELQQRLLSSNLQANIVPVDSGTLPPPNTSTDTTLPVPNGRVVVVLDPGHGGPDPGAVGIGGLQEKEAVLAISRQVATALEQQGIQVVMTRPDDRDLDLEPRVRLAERANADIFVSIHANSISMSRPDVNGLETYHYSTTSQRLAQVIHNNLLQTTDLRDRGVRQARFYVIKNTSMPAVLVEIGFVTGREDAARLSSATGRSQIAQGITRGILQYVRSNVR